MKTSRMIVAMVMMLVLFVGSLTTAQEVDTCFGLDAEACTTIAEATAATSMAESFYQNFSIDFVVAGTPDGDDLRFSVVGEGSAALNMMQDFPVNFDVTMTVEFGEGPVDLSARLIDGMLYVLVAGEDAWLGIDIVQAIESGDFPIDLADLFGDADEAMDDLPVDELAGFAPLLAIPGFLSYVNVGNVFTFTADFTALATAPELMNALEIAGELAGDPTIASLGMLVPMLLREGTITVTQVVDGGIVAELGFGLAFVIDAGMLTGDMSADPLDLSLDFNVALSQINASFDFVVPENVQMMMP